MLSRLLGNGRGWWLLSGVLALGCASTAAWSGGGFPGALAGSCAAVAVLALSSALRLRGRERAARTRQRAAEALAEVRAAELRHLATVRAPEIAKRVRNGQRVDGAPGPLASASATGEEFDRSLAAVVDALGSDEAVRRERALRDSVQAAFESVARNMHAMATVQLQVLDNVEKIISDPRLMAEVMRADHAAAQMTRKAQTLLVMCGIWPARRESKPVSLYDCVRGAQSRIVEFGRVEVHGGQTLYAVPQAVEGMMHAIAELLENATVFSPSNTQVVVTVREVGAGAVIEIDDAGLGMPPDILHQAVGQLRDDIDLAKLGAVPRLGLACVGRWARELGINVELTGASAYGGTRAVLFVPHRLLTEPSLKNPRRGWASADSAREAGVHGGVAHARAPEPVLPPVSQETHIPGPRSETGAARPVDHAPPGAEQGPGPLDRGPHLPVPQDSARRRYSPPLPPPHPGALPPQTDSPPTAQPDQPAATRSGLPKRRSRRRGSSSHSMPGQPPPLSGSFDAFSPAPSPRKAPADNAWTPEAARASVASVLSGTRRGRAEAAERPDEQAPTHPSSDHPPHPYGDRT